MAIALFAEKILYTMDLKTELALVYHLFLKNKKGAALPHTPKGVGFRAVIRMKEPYFITSKDVDYSALEEVLLRGINSADAHIPGIKPSQSFALALKDETDNLFGGITGTSIYGSLHIDMIWIAENLRGQGWGGKLVRQAENIGRERNCSFATLNTMSFQALPFYLKLGYTIEFTRAGYLGGAKMYCLRKPLTNR